MKSDGHSSCLASIAPQPPPQEANSGATILTLVQIHRNSAGQKRLYDSVPGTIALCAMANGR